jgi:hypothetical protein
MNRGTDLNQIMPLLFSCNAGRFVQNQKNGGQVFSAFEICLASFAEAFEARLNNSVNEKGDDCFRVTAGMRLQPRALHSRVCETPLSKLPLARRATKSPR